MSIEFTEYNNGLCRRYVVRLNGLTLHEGYVKSTAMDFYFDLCTCIGRSK